MSRQWGMAIERSVMQAWGRSRNRLLLWWLLGGTGTTALLIWNWRLVLAASSGMGAMAAVYWLQQQDLSTHWRTLTQKFQGPQRLLAIAVLSGSTTAFGTYVMASVWATTENHWLATASLTQGVGVLGILALVSWQAMQRPLLHVDRAYEQLIWRLTAPYPLKRLMAVRQLTRHYRRYTRSQQQELQEYFVMLLADEVHPKVRQSLLSAIAQFQDHQREVAPLPVPLQLQTTPTPELELQPRSQPSRRQAHHQPL
ncbi:MAG: hypothetical protein F6J87_22190 [Spirulina sp. SIO3F2]|nr:hypothetical protein [Spirulina sp. SIO3F2]